MITQLQPPIPLKTPKGKAWAVALIDYGPQWDLQWVTFIHNTGECWTFRNSEIRQESNYTFNLPEPTAIAPRAQTMRPHINGSMNGSVNGATNHEIPQVNGRG